jgi:hypothetical protein
MSDECSIDQVPDNTYFVSLAILFNTATDQPPDKIDFAISSDKGYLFSSQLRQSASAKNLYQSTASPFQKLTGSIFTNAVLNKTIKLTLSEDSGFDYIDDPIGLSSVYRNSLSIRCKSNAVRAVTLKYKQL